MCIPLYMITTIVYVHENITTIYIQYYRPTGSPHHLPAAVSASILYLDAVLPKWCSGENERVRNQAHPSLVPRLSLAFEETQEKDTMYLVHVWLCECNENTALLAIWLIYSCSDVSKIWSLVHMHVCTLYMNCWCPFLLFRSLHRPFLGITCNVGG